MPRIAIFYHCLVWLNGEPHERCFNVVQEQMEDIRRSGLLDRANEFHVGLNGGDESKPIAELVLPAKAQVTYHGLKSRCENLTIVMLEEWLKTHPGWLVLYLHTKGSVTCSGGENFARRWRRCAMRNLVLEWRKCVQDLQDYESVGVHWMPGMVNGTQNIWAGNCFWARSDFLRILPSIFLRDRIKQSGIEALESRYESEVWLGNGPRLPSIKDYHPGGPFGNPCV